MGARSSRNKAQNNRSDGHLLEYFRNTFVRGGGGTNYVPQQGLVATGGSVIPASQSGDGYRYHVFLSSSTFVVQQLSDDAGSYPNSVEYLVVAGGGGGGDVRGGGGGAGGALSSTLSVSAQTYPVTVGSGGAAGIDGSSMATRGTDSGFASITTKGGGAGSGRYPYPNPSGNPQINGGSGGAGGVESFNIFGYGYNPSTPAPVLTSVPLPSPYPLTQGNNGGVGNGTGNGGGGGGRGSVGANTPEGQHGGLAGSFPSFPSSVIAPKIPAPISGAWNNTVTNVGYYAGGGAGGNQSPELPIFWNIGGRGPLTPGNAPSTQPFGGGGNGGQGPAGGLPPTPRTNTAGSPGLNYTGGGGGGGSDNQPGGTGGAGIVIVRYSVGYAN